MSRGSLLHSCVAGLLPYDMARISYIDGNDYIADINYILGEGTLRPHHVRGQLRIMQPLNYDMVVFSLLREMFGMGFPQMLIVDYGYSGRGNRCIAIKRFPDRELRLSDYYPYTRENFTFRYQLCLLVYLCKLVGCFFSLRDVRVMNGVPFFWRASSLGYKNARTISSDEFAILYEIHPKVARTIFNSPTHELIDSGMLGKVNPEGRVLADDELLNMIIPNVKYDDIKNTMFARVVAYFRDVNFDLDTVRECIYIRENAVRSALGNRKEFKLSRNPRDIEHLIEENHSILCGPYPFRIFKG